MEISVECLSGERWEKIANYDGYWISSYGRVFTTKRKIPKLRKIATDKDGYSVIALVKDSTTKTRKIHRLVATAFVENKNPDKFWQVNHIDGDKKNNKPENLEWCDQYHNMKHSIRVLGNKVKNLEQNHRMLSHPLKIKDPKTKKFKEYPSKKAAIRAIGRDVFAKSEKIFL